MLSKEYFRKKAKEYYRRNKEIIKAKARKYRAENKEKIKEQRKHWKSRRTEGLKANIKFVVLSYYGNGKPACVRCGFRDIRALTLDHIHGLQGEKRKCTGVQFYKMLQDQGCPEGYQTLCANCQMIKMFEEHEWTKNR